MDKKILIGLALLCSACTAGWANNAADETAYPEIAGNASGMTASVESQKTQNDKAKAAVPDSARSAANNYEAAMLSGSASDRDKYLAEAISCIAEAAAEQPENPDILLLASQIYRAKGGLSYARSYYKRACNLYKTIADLRPDDNAAQLAMAIACYAGDARYENANAYEASKALGESYAQCVLTEKSAPQKTSEQGAQKDESVQQVLPEKFFEQEVQKNETVPSAGLTDGEQETDSATNFAPVKNSARDVEKILAALVLQDKDLQKKFYDAMDHSTFTAREAQVMELYEKVEEGSWLWNVRSEQAAEQELLLKYLRLW